MFSNFSGKIRSNISGLGIDTTTDSSEEGNSRTTKSISRDKFEKFADRAWAWSEINITISKEYTILDDWAFVCKDKDLKEDKSETYEAETEDLTTLEGNLKASI